MKYCANCGNELNDSTVFCENCGTKCEAPAQQPPMYSVPVYEAAPVEQPLSTKDKVLSIIGMVLGIISLVWAVFTLIFSFIPGLGVVFSAVGFEFAIPGIILSSIGNKSGNSKMGKVGKVFSLICIILFGVFLFISIIVTAALGAAVESGSGYYF